MGFDVLNTEANKDKIAVVVVGYNRLKSITRLLNSLIAADYCGLNVPLIISIDCSGDEELYKYVNDFKWVHGQKYVNIQKERLGLLKHIYQCGDLSKYFKAIILLEDDLVVSPVFYSYALQTVNYYKNDSSIAEISLYKNETNGYVGLPFVNEQNGYDVFLMQDVSTWGECWTPEMWESFVEWRDCHTEEDVLNIDMTDIIKSWTRAWSKYYNAYVVATHKYVLYPNIAVTTNFSDAGEHGGDNNSLVQVNLQQKDFQYRFAPSDKLVKYDIYFNNESLYEWLGFSVEDVCLDLYNFHPNTYKKSRYILSTRKLGYKIVKTYALHMRPWELNVKHNISGTGITLYDTTVKARVGGEEVNEEVIPYYLQGMNMRLIAKHVLKKISKKIFKWI